MKVLDSISLQPNYIAFLTLAELFGSFAILSKYYVCSLFNGRIYRDLKKPKDSDKIQNELVQDYSSTSCLQRYCFIYWAVLYVLDF